MADSTLRRNKVFISYDHADKKYFEELRLRLQPYVRSGIVDIWDDTQIAPGLLRQEEINKALQSAKVAVLLISATYLASDVLIEHEFPTLLAAAKEEGATILPIILNPCAFEDTPLAAFQAINHLSEPVSSMRKSQREALWVRAAKVAKEALQAQPGNTLDTVQDNAAQTSHKARQEPSRAVGRKKPTQSSLFPTLWNVPYRYAFFFTGRDLLVEQIYMNFISQHSFDMAPFQALTGLGGLGKTQTAVAYAYRYRQQYQAVFWIRAETESTLLASFRSMAELLNLPEKHVQQRESLLMSIQERLRKTADWLLIFDNADHLRLVEPFLPKGVGGHVLLTTRSTAMDALAHPHALNPLQPDEGALCILRRANLISWNSQFSDASPANVRAAQELSLLMGGLPLALEQAGAYIETTGRGVGGYLELYKKYRPELQQNYYGDVHWYRDAVAFAWNIARAFVQQESAAAIEILYLCTFLGPAAIPYEVFTKGTQLLGETLGPVAADPIALDRAIALLRKHSLIKNEVDRDTDIPRLFIHPVLQEVLKDGMKPPTQRLWAERAARVIREVFHEGE